MFMAIRKILQVYLFIYFLDNKMVELYESAAKGYPNNEEILTQLFMAYVRVGDYQKQQQVGVSFGWSH